MLGLKSFAIAAVVIGGIEVADNGKKGQCKTAKLGGCSTRMPESWWAALAA